MMKLKRVGDVQLSPDGRWIAKDYRMPIEQGLGMFTALQLHNDEVLGWLDRWTKG